MLSGSVELDDFFLAARDRTKRRQAGRGTDEQPMICAVERRGEGEAPGRCVIRVVADCSGATYRQFAEEHVSRDAYVRADGWGGIRAGLAEWESLDQRAFDADDPDASLPTVHHLISNFEAWALGTFHGLSITYLQSYADEFSWRYSHRAGDATSELLADCCLGYYARSELHSSVFLPQPKPKKPPKRPRGRPRKHPVLQL